MMKQIFMACMIAGTLAATDSMAQDRGGRKRPDAQEMFNKLDTDGDGKKSKAEADKGERGKLKENFAAIDANGDGYLEKTELKAFRDKKREERKK